jgi:hypothetical protein
MIYLTNDTYDQAVYFEVRRNEPRRRTGGTEHVLSGLLGNGVTEVPVTVRSWRDCVEVVFGREDLFPFVEERLLRRMLGEVVREMTLH